MSDGDFVGGLLVGFIEAGKGLAGVSGLMISCSNLSGDQMKDRLLQKESFPIVFNPQNCFNLIVQFLRQSKTVSNATLASLIETTSGISTAEEC